MNIDSYHRPSEEANLCQEIDEVVAPFQLSNSSPEYIDKFFSLNTWVMSSLPKVQFTDKTVLAHYSNAFNEWKKAYSDIQKTAARITGGEATELETALFNSDKRQCLNSFQIFVTGFFATVAKHPVASLEEAAQVFQENASFANDDTERFGGVHLDYSLLLQYARSSTGAVWLNQLIRAYSPEIQPGTKVEIAPLDAWIKSMAHDKTAPPDVQGAIERIGVHFQEYLKREGFGDEIVYPLQPLMIQEDMIKRVDALPLRRWLQEAKAHFSPETGWSAPPDLVTKLKEEAFLIYALQPEGTTREMKYLVEDIVKYYYTNELMVKYHSCLK